MGLVHRDLKPANVFVAVRGGESDVSKVLDFGLVKLTRDPSAANLTSDMTVSGTPMFMAPEQTVGDRSLDARADIYALGAVMYHALTGQPPFVGENAFAIMMAHSRDPVVPPSQLNPTCPGGSRAGGSPLPGQEARRSLPECEGAGPGPGGLRRRLGMGRQPSRSLVGGRGAGRPAEESPSEAAPGRRENLADLRSILVGMPPRERTSMSTRPARRVGALPAFLVLAGLMAGSSGWMGNRAGPIGPSARAWIAAAGAADAAGAPKAAPAGGRLPRRSPRKRRRSGHLMISTSEISTARTPRLSSLGSPKMPKWSRRTGCGTRAGR